MLYLILGPSGVGKSVQVKKLRENHPDFVFPKSVSTRKMRPGESQGNPYFFISDEEFDQHIAAEDFLEYAVVHESARYGTLKQPIQEAVEQDKVVIKELDIQGLKKVWETIAAGKADFLEGKLASIFLLPPSEEVLINRIVSRSEIKERELNQRLESARREVEQAHLCTHQVKVEDEDSIEEVYEKVGKIIVPR
ncbi:MAG: guanylate kinase [bacterium]|nr:guanylate kinase [bacterium]